MIKELSRKELYNLVWQKPMIQIAKDYGFSDRGLGKLCVKYQIPVPSRGYWQKVKNGQKIEIPKLEKISDIEDNIIILKPKIKVSTNIFPDSIKELITVEQQPENKIVVDYDIKKYHQIIENWNRIDKSYNRKIDHKANKILNALIKALEERSYIVTNDEGRYRAVKVGTGCDKVELWVSKYVKTYKKKIGPEDGFRWEWQRSDDEYTFVKEKTDFYAVYVKGHYNYENKKFIETEDVSIDSLLNKVIIYIIKKLYSDKNKRLEIEANHRKWELERQEAARQKELIKRNQEKKENLINDANAWKQAQNIREYVYAVQENICIEQKAYFKMWSAWAFQCADEIDPMKRMNFKNL